MTDKANISSDGHRQRIRDKFLKNGGSSFADYELLEAYLTIAIPRRDVKPLAKQLIAKFGSFADVQNCPQVLSGKASLEVMCHPDLDQGGILVDRDGSAPYDAPFGIPMETQVSCLCERN